MDDLDKKHTTNGFQRFAVYFAPRTHTVLGQFGQSWFGGANKLPYLPIHELTKSPRRYGFHATLKAPMRLRTDISSTVFFSEVKKLAQRLKSVDLGYLCIDRINNFLALTPCVSKNQELANLAWSCVSALDHMRAALNEAELRKRPGLTNAEKQNLIQWGYPHVGNNFRFHMTLTSSLEEIQFKIAQSELRSKLGNTLDQPVVLDSLCIFGDPGDAQDFKLVQRFDLQQG